jgi:hypothetical protein
VEPKKRSLRDAVREHQQKAGQKQVAAPAAAPAEPLPQEKPAGSKPPPPAFDRFEDVPAACGHSVPFGLYPDKKDKFREQRRKKITDRPCAECRQKAHQERTAKEKAEGQGRRKNKPAKVEGWKREASRNLGRLPHGSRFANLVYDAEKQEWSGTLEIPTVAETDGNGKLKTVSFSAVASGVFRLLSVLDRQYREWSGQKAYPPPIEIDGSEPVVSAVP